MNSEVLWMSDVLFCFAGRSKFCTASGAVQEFTLTHQGGLLVRRIRRQHFSLLLIDQSATELRYLTPRLPRQRDHLRSMPAELVWLILAVGQSLGDVEMADLLAVMGDVRPTILCRWEHMSSVVKGVVGPDTCIVLGCNEAYDKKSNLGRVVHLCAEHVKVRHCQVCTGSVNREVKHALIAAMFAERSESSWRLWHSGRHVQMLQQVCSTVTPHHVWCQGEVSYTGAAVQDMHRPQPWTPASC